MKAPFAADGSLLHYARWDAHEFREAEPFQADLTIVGTCRGRSAAYFVWKDVLGREYPMFLTDMADLLRRGVIEFGTVHDAEWRIQKRGANFGIRLAADE